jgi:hypothetical protein
MVRDVGNAAALTEANSKAKSEAKSEMKEVVKASSRGKNEGADVGKAPEGAEEGAELTVEQQAMAQTRKLAKNIAVAPAAADLPSSARASSRSSTSPKAELLLAKNETGTKDEATRKPRVPPPPPVVPSHAEAKVDGNDGPRNGLLSALRLRAGSGSSGRDKKAQPVAVQLPRPATGHESRARIEIQAVLSGSGKYLARPLERYGHGIQ